MTNRRKRVLSEKQKKYADEYLLSHDTLQAYVKAGYAKTIEEAYKSHSYSRPLKSKAIQEYFLTKKVQNKLLRKELKIKEKEIDLKIKKIVNYDDDSPVGMNVSQFLKDVIYDPKNYMKDRLEALKILLKYKLIIQPTESVPIIINNIKK